MSDPRSTIEHIFETLPPGPEALADVDEAALVDAAVGWARLEAAAAARRLAAIAELVARRADSSSERDRWACDPFDATAAEVAREMWDRIGKKGDDWEHFVRDEKGLTPENGWQPQKYAPNGRLPTQEGARRWDFANFNSKQAVECKGGQVNTAVFTKQIGEDIMMVKKRGWRVTWYIREPLNPEQMTTLARYKAETGGRFNFVEGMP